MENYDGELVLLRESTVQKARKDHRCALCAAVIERGSPYHRVVFLQCGEFTTEAECQRRAWCWDRELTEIKE